MASPKKFSLTRARDERLVELVKTTDHKKLAIWAIDCAERVMPYFEEKYPQDSRPRKAIETLREWIRTGIFSMAVIRKASLDAHAAARDVGEDNAARSAAHAAGQAVATAHVPTHSLGPAVYALQAIHRATAPADAEAAIDKEKEWQYQHLLKIRKSQSHRNRRVSANKQWFFYIVRCNDNSLYSGMTNNLEKRVKAHNNGTGAKYTASHRPVTLVHSECFSTSSKARQRENEVKNWPKNKKEALISIEGIQQKGGP